MRTLVTTDIGIHEVVFDVYREIEGGPVYVGEMKGFVRVARVGDELVVAASFQRETIEKIDAPDPEDDCWHEEYPWSGLVDNCCCRVNFLQIHDRPDTEPPFLFSGQG